MGVEFTPGERLQYDRAVAAGRDVSAPVRVTFFFGLESPGSRPDATEEALLAMGVAEVVVDEEISGDGWWHVAAFTALRLTPEAIHGSKWQMMQLAVATGIRYHGWQVSLNGGELAQLASRRPDLAGAVSDELPPDDTLAAVEIPDLADLIWLFEDEPTVEYPDLAWPVGLHSFRLRRGDREVLFSVDPASGDAQISLYVAGQEMACLGRLRWIETFTIVKKDGYEGLVLHFAGGQHEPLTLQTRPEIRLTWDVVPPLGA
jgi:hypothetical protein